MREDGALFEALTHELLFVLQACSLNVWACDSAICTAYVVTMAGHEACRLQLQDLGYVAVAVACWTARESRQALCLWLAGESRAPRCRRTSCRPTCFRQASDLPLAYVVCSPPVA